MQDKGRRALKRLAKRLVLKRLSAVLLPVFAPLLLAALGLLLAAMLCAAVYCSMPSAGTYAGVEPSEMDRVIREAAQKLADEYNVVDTWLVGGSGGRRERLGFLADRYGHDRELANQWGDVYAPAMQKAFQVGGENKLEDPGWVERELKRLAKDLHPEFYYKESTVKVCGPGGCEAYTVFLLVEADTIRGHYRFFYEWVTESSGDRTVTYEKYAGRELLGPQWERLEKYLKAYLDVPDRDLVLARQMVFEAGQGFTARKEWLGWLSGAFGGAAAWASGAMVPADLMPFFQEAEARYGIPWWFLAAVAFRESSFNPLAENSRSGCFGLMQVSPSNWKHYAPQLGFDVERDRQDPRAQVMVGAQILAEHMGSVDWSGDWEEATLPALAFYSGHRSPGGRIDPAAMERCREEYAEDVWAVARALRGVPSGTWPTPGHTEVTSYFGYRRHPITGKWQLHAGIDIGAPAGAPVVSVSGGIAYAGYDPGGYGIYVVVKDAVHEYYYAHLSAAAAVSGQAVRPGDLLGFVGSTGASTGPHLHFGVKLLDTSTWLDPLSILKGA